MQKLLVINVLILIPFFVFSQGRKCAIGEVVDVNLSKRYDDIQSAINKLDNGQGLKKLRTDDAIINIPVVVHIIHDNVSGIIGGQTNTNISDEQVFSQIKVLNNDFRKAANTMGYNSNPDGADFEFNFYLATKTPDGLPTNGINRVYSSKGSWDVYSELEQLSALSYWDSNRYLNIWVTTISNGYIGYAEFPTGDFNGLDFEETNEKTDGVVIAYTSFGNNTGTTINAQYAYGRTLTHEIGHWFGLIHTWGDKYCGDDFCNDTPQAERPNYDKCLPVFSYCNNNESQNMIENYMDYTADACMNIFTNDQKIRVRKILEISKRRQRFVSNAILAFEKVEEPTLFIFNNPSNASLLKIQAIMPDYQDFELAIVDEGGRQIFSRKFIGYPGIDYSFSELTTSKGLFFVVLKTAKFKITKRIVVL